MPHEPIAIIGMAGRFPGATDVAGLWDNLCAGVESVEWLSEAQLIEAGASQELLRNPRHVRATATAANLDRFDARFFGVSPREAQLMDPQLRVALETVWEALEDAGLDPRRDGGQVGIYMGATLSSYLCNNLLPNRSLLDQIGADRFWLLNDKDFYPTTISYRLDLRGPSLSIGTACSSSLVAVHVACQSLAAGECRAAIAGGSSVHVPLRRGYLHTEGGIYSPDGHCRAFDAEAGGIVGADGAAFVVLKRYSDAVADRNQIHALILGTAVNNDGADKAGYTAPSINGQAAVVRKALDRAGVRADEIGYLEAHGTGTFLGDPVEIAALTDAFRADTPATGFCALGSLKSNIGHLDTAAGVAGLIKAALVVRHGVVPPTINVSKPNPYIDFAASPFVLNRAVRPWEGDGPRRAGVSALGVGGTNVHAILEAPPVLPAEGHAVGPWIIPVSGTDDATFQTAADRLRDALHPHVALGDIERTLACGRRHFPTRRALVAENVEQLRAQLAVARAVQPDAAPGLLMFAPPSSAGRPSSGTGIFAHDLSFRDAVSACIESIDDRACAEWVWRSFGRVTPDEDGPATPAWSTAREFVLQYALSRMVSGWGVRPSLLLGLEVGELVAGVVAGSLTLGDGLRLARLLTQQPSTGAALVMLSPRDLAGMLPDRSWIAAVYGPELSVVAGPADTLAQFRSVCRRAGIPCRGVTPLQSHAEAIAGSFARGQAAVPIISPETGEVGGRGASQADYMYSPRRRTYRLDEAMRTAARSASVWLELGSGRLLSTLARHSAASAAAMLPGLPPAGGTSEYGVTRQWLAALWEHGFEPDWRRALDGRGGRTCSLPAFPFRSERHWIEAPAPVVPEGAAALSGAALAGELARVETSVQQRRGPVLYMPGALRADLDSFVLDVIVDYFTSHGITDGSTWSVEQIEAHLGVVTKLRRCVQYFLAVLEEERLVVRSGERIHVVFGDAPRRDVEDGCRSLVSRHPSFKGLIELVAHCARNLSSALTTDYGGLETLYPGGSDRRIRASIDETVSYGALPHAVETLCRWVADEWLPRFDRPVRILEVGMGGGILTWSLAPLLPAGVEYVATDITQAMLSEAEKRGRRDARCSMTFRRYDLTRDPAAQGFSRESFDLILAEDALHVVPNIRAALERLRELLRPGGVLGIVESTNRDRWLNLVWGLSEGWWQFDDRELTPLMHASAWESAIQAAGFQHVALAPLAREAGADCALLLAGKPAVAAPRAATGGPRELPPKRSDIGEWFYTPVWRPWTVPEPAHASAPQRWLLFAGDGVLSEALADDLHARGHQVIQVRPDRAWARAGAHEYRVRPDVPGDYMALIQSVLDEAPVDGLLHCWTARPPADTDALDRLETEQSEGLHSLIHTMQALGARHVTSPIRLGIVTANTQEVTGGDLLRPEQATLKSAAKIVPQEYPNVSCVHVDLDLRRPPSRQAALAVLRLIHSDSPERFLACRDGGVFSLGFDKASAPAVSRPSLLEDRGAYLITGGLGGIALELARWLAGETCARLVLLGRTGLPPRSEWDRLAFEQGTAGDRVRLVRQIEAAGSEVLVVEADLCDESAVARALTEAERRFGRIQGVIHAAGLVDREGVIQRRTREATDRVMAPKVRGTLVLDRLFRDRPVDFFVLCSALGATLYGLKFGEIGYVAGNDFLNAYGHAARSRGAVNAMSISWTDWIGIGMASRAHNRAQAGRGSDGGPTLLEGMTPAEGLDVFRRAMQRGLTETHVCTQDLHLMLEQQEFVAAHGHEAFWAGGIQPAETHAPAPPDASSRTGGDQVDEQLEVIWRDLLGVAEIAPEDDFFDVGGDSLVAIRMIERVKETFDVQQTLAGVFEAPTFRQFSDAVRTAMRGTSGVLR